jgi:hypothetical protein
MAEIKNAFIKSKMNKDLDARLLPSGEYRSAMNISISQSEGADVGAVENIKGNENVLALNAAIENIPALDIIGYFMDEQNNYIYLFSTDQNKVISEKVDLNANCFIHRFDPSTTTENQKIKKIVEGAFLNFSKQSFMTAVNLLEDFLFFTDNRNQPRVINVRQAFEDTSYYKQESDISVAKLAPYKVINILDANEATVNTIVDVNNFTVTPVSSSVKVGDVVSRGVTKLGQVVSYDENTGNVEVDINISLNPGDTVKFARSGMVNRSQQYLIDNIENPNYNSEWEGDTDFIEDKFIRFAYRYKFEDNTYSLISPFTATMFIPKQFGYFLESDEEKTYKSSIVAFMENFTQEIKLKIPFPSNDPLNDYKIKEVDIIYKESDTQSLKVLTTLDVNNAFKNLLNGDDNEYTFLYESRKPYKTLPGSEIVRVYDKVPIKAQSQEIISNRVVYANYIDKSDCIKNIDYYVTAQEKDYTRFDNLAQYPYHTLKQSRTYQAGFVLSDKYGRTSSVLLSSKDITPELGRGSSFFHGYKTEGDNNPNEEPFGDALRLEIEGTIRENKDSGYNGLGYPGAYADSTGKVWTIEQATNSTINNSEYTIDQDLTGFLSEGDYLKGKNIDYVEIVNISYLNGSTTISTEKQIADYYTEPGIVFGYTINELGWYSYKIVVKQTEQSYYNVYLPGIINGTFSTVNVDTNQSAVVVLLNDNINKVPRDLSEVGPQQKQFRSSVRLFGRVTPQPNAVNPTFNTQWYPATSADNVSEIATTEDLGFTEGSPDIYNQISKPLVARIATIPSLEINNELVTIGSLPPSSVVDPYPTFLGVYETTPTESLLDIFYETSSTGLISELNRSVKNSIDTGAENIIDWQWYFAENSDASEQVPFTCTQAFKFANGAGTELDENDIPTTPEIVNVYDGNNNIVFNHPFTLVEQNPSNRNGSYLIQTTKTFTYLENSSSLNNYTFEIQVTTSNGITTNLVKGDNALTNINPIRTENAPTARIIILENQSTVLNLVDPAVFENGSAIENEKLDDFNYEIILQERTLPQQETVTFFSIQNNILVVDPNQTLLDEEYNLTIRASDANKGEGSLFVDLSIEVNIGQIPLNYKNPINYNTPTCVNGYAGYAFIYTFGVDTTIPANKVAVKDLTMLNETLVYRGNPVDSGNLIIVEAETERLEEGIIRFTIQGTEPTICIPSGMYTAEWVYFVTYRENDNSQFSLAVDVNGQIWPYYGKQTVMGQSNSYKITIGDFNIPGQYRVIISPPDAFRLNQSDSLCNPTQCNLDPEFDETGEFIYCDAHYGSC